MKIEFLYKDDTYIAQINDIKDSLKLLENDIWYSPNVKTGLNMFSFYKHGENKNTAKALDEIKANISKKLDSENLFIITDDVSNYFCQRLYPQLANFERNLRKIIYIASIKSKDEKALALCKEIENLEFAKIYQILFSDEKYVVEAKKIVNSNSPAFSKQDMIKRLNQLTESNLWNKLFNGEYSYIPENFLMIKDGRNKVMHSRNISFEEYSNIKSNLKKSNAILVEIENNLLQKNNYNLNEALQNISKALSVLSSEMSNRITQAVTKKLVESFSNLFLPTNSDNHIADDTNIEITDNSNNSSFIEDTEEEESNEET